MRNILFPPNKRSRRASVGMFLLIEMVVFWAFISKPELFNSTLLKDLAELSITIVLTVAALGIGVLQISAGLQDSEEIQENQTQFINYVFEMLTVISYGILGYVLAIFFPEWSLAIQYFALIEIQIILFAMVKTMVYFVKHFNIRD